MSNKPELKLLTDKQLEARDQMAEYLSLRLDSIIAERIDNLIRSFLRGEPEGVDEIKWEWTVVIKEKELDELRNLARTLRGEE